MAKLFCKMFGHKWLRRYDGRIPFSLPIWRCVRCKEVARRHTSPDAPDTKLKGDE